MNDAWTNVLSGAAGAIVTGFLGFVVVQRQFREQTRQRKRVVYAELIAALQDYTRVVNRVVMRSFEDTDPLHRENIAKYLSTNPFPEISDALGRVNDRIAAAMFIAPNSVFAEVVLFNTTALDRHEYFAEMGDELQSADDREEAWLMIVARAWGHGPEFTRLVKELRHDAGAWETPDLRTALELMSGKAAPDRS